MTTVAVAPTANATARIRRWRGSLDGFDWLSRMFLGGWIVLQCVPLLYVVGVSLSKPSSSSDMLLYILPRQPTLENYVAVFPFFDSSIISLWRLLLNNTIYALAAVFGALVVAAPASFAFATLQFRGRRLLLYAMLLQLVIPFEMIMVPEFVTLRVLNLQDGYQSVILPSIGLGLALPVLILTTFFRQVPPEIVEAATIDGCNRLQVFRYIALPLALPAVATVTIFLFLSNWNAFSLPLITVKSADLMNLPLALAGLAGWGRAERVPWELLATAIVVASLPVTGIFLVLQGKLVDGLTEGAVKG